MLQKKTPRSYLSLFNSLYCVQENVITCTTQIWIYMISVFGILVM